MMEAMQIEPAHFGPQLVGPGTGTVGGCVFEPTLGRGAFQRIAQKNLGVAEKAMIIDAATAHSEQKGEIGHYKLLVRNTTYRNKITDEIVSEKTLVSPDFNYEAAGVWTSAGEKGTVGTIEEYHATVDRARELAQIETDASMFWVNPSLESDVHRAYLWVKKGDTVEAYQYIIPGRRKAVSTMMKKLGYQNDDSKPLEEQTIIRLGNEPKIHHKDVFDAVVSSLSLEEAKKTKSILDKFRQEAELPDSFRQQRLKNYQGEYEAKLNNEKLKKVYENDIEKWLTSVAQGFAAIDRIDNNGGTRESTFNDKSLIADQTKIDNLAYYDYQSMQNNKDKLDKKETIFRVLQPIIPGIIGLTGIFDDYDKHFEAENIQEIGNSEENGLGEDRKAKNPNNRCGERFEITIEDKDSSSESIFWQEFISAIFEPTDNKIKPTGVLTDLKRKKTSSDVEDFMIREKGLPEISMGMMPLLHADKINEIQQPTHAEELSVLKTNFQQGLESMVRLISISETKESDTARTKQEGKRQMTAEADIVKLGEEIIKTVLSFENKLQLSPIQDSRPIPDSLVNLSFLIDVYHDKNSSPEVKHFWAILIYKQIEKIQEDKKLLLRYPQLEIFVKKFQQLVPHTGSLAVRFEVLLQTLQNIYEHHIFDKNNLESIVFIIERLPSLIHFNTKNLFLSKNKKKKQKLAKNGMIFRYQDVIIYRYSSLLATHTSV